MLPAAARLRRAEDFSRAVRGGHRAGRPTLVLHLQLDEAGRDAVTTATRVAAPRVGFVVSRAVGPAVVRNRVRRRLRHLIRARLGRLPAGAVLVVRALPPAARASSAVLAADLEGALGRLGLPAGSVAATPQPGRAVPRTGGRG